IASDAFAQNDSIPENFTCDVSTGTPALSPALKISDVPSNAKTLALVMHDPDVPPQLRPDGIFVHWVAFNIPTTTTMIPEGASAGISGSNGAGKSGYVGPCPPKEYQPDEHRYIFTLYALDTEFIMPTAATRDELLSVMQGHILSEAVLVGRYKRK
ncbi:MAG: YbhB/YbcL family Raf kinase inhibitor-like protein, partial [Candidatus Nitrotoga sp.]